MICFVSGNGKRSDPGSLIDDSSDGRRRISLQKILAGNIGEREEWRPEQEEEIRSQEQYGEGYDDITDQVTDRTRSQRERELLRKLVGLHTLVESYLLYMYYMSYKQKLQINS